MYHQDPVYGDELLQRKIKTLHPCATKGCEIPIEGKNKWCDDCSSKEVREEVKKNWLELHPNQIY